MKKKRRGRSRGRGGKKGGRRDEEERGKRGEGDEHDKKQ